MMTLTTSLRRKITEDWARSFPGLGIYKPLHLLRRAGPIVMGIALNRNEAGTHYKPTFHVHVLLKKAPAILLNLASPLRGRNGVADLIQVKWHEAKFQEAVERMRASCLLPMEGDIHFEQVLEAFDAWLRSEKWPYWPQVLEDRLLLCAWARRSEAFALFMRDAEATLRSWPLNVQQQIGGIEVWLEKVRKAAAELELLERNVADEIAAHKLERVPAAALLL